MTLFLLVISTSDMGARETMLIGVASGRGAADPGCQDDSEVIRRMGFLRDLEQAVHALCESVASL